MIIAQNLAKIGLRELPSTIGELVQLDTLHLCYNKYAFEHISFSFSDMGETYDCTYIFTLFLVVYSIQTLPESMACLVNLRILRYNTVVHVFFGIHFLYILMVFDQL